MPSDRQTSSKRPSKYNIFSEYELSDFRKPWRALGKFLDVKVTGWDESDKSRRRRNSDVGYVRTTTFEEEVEEEWTDV